MVRSLCTVCGGRNTQHRNRGEEDRKGQAPRIAFDFWFMSHQDEAASESPMLIMVDEGIGDNYTRAVGQEGMGIVMEENLLVSNGIGVVFEG